MESVGLIINIHIRIVTGGPIDDADQTKPLVKNRKTQQRIEDRLEWQREAQSQYNCMADLNIPSLELIRLTEKSRE